MLKNKANYKTYEYTYSTEVLNAIIIAHVEREMFGYILNIWLKTSENMGLIHFVTGFSVDDDSELSIRREVERLADCEYFDNVIDVALEDEARLEVFHCEE